MYYYMLWFNSIRGWKFLKQFDVFLFGSYFDVCKSYFGFKNFN